MRLPLRVRLTPIALLLACGCTETRQIPPPLDYLPRTVVEVARYDVRHDAEVLGTLVLLEIADRDGPLRFWRVQNNSGGWVGHASEQLRFSRRVPFREDEQDLGIWPMAQGVARLFGVDGAVQLRERAVAAPADARSQR